MRNRHIAILFAVAGIGCGLWWASSRDPGIKNNPRTKGVTSGRNTGLENVGKAWPRERVDKAVDGQETPGTPKPEGPYERMLAMHLQPAPEDIQLTYMRVAELERDNYRRQADSYEADSTDGIDAYLSYLIQMREVKVRDLARAALLRGEGVLVFPMVDKKSLAKFGAGRPIVRYLGVGTYFGSTADLAVAIDGTSGEVTDLGASINEVALAGLREFVARFNSLPDKDRYAALAKEKTGGKLPGLSKDVAYLCGDLLVRHESAAILTVGK